MKTFVIIVCTLALQVNCQGIFDLLENMQKLESIPQTLPILDTEGMSNIKSVALEMSQITNSLPEAIAQKLGSLINESNAAIASISNSSDIGPMYIAIKGAKRALSGVEENVLGQLVENVEKVYAAQDNLSQVATNTYSISEMQVLMGVHPVDEYIVSRIRVLDPDEDIAVCLKKVKSELDEQVLAANLKVSQCISEKVDQGKNATANIDTLIDESRKTLQKSVGMVKDCVANISAVSTAEENDTATTCLINSSSKVVSKEFTAGIQIATKTSMNLEAIQAATNSIPGCVPGDLIKTSFDLDDFRKKADACI
ncbi:uncharacterized protein LOC143910265 [Arctopsyche grandis]|uniref:uncharacterized protein LOC143910265 n=1 Tax=Arctopsyche grandis TaxID=121162 RepID=UPI00406D937E